MSRERKLDLKNPTRMTTLTSSLKMREGNCVVISAYDNREPDNFRNDDVR